jgi:phosphomannomutase/phosphoglucomutase
MIETGDLASGEGSETTADVVTPYVAEVSAQFHFARRTRVVFDAGNGTGGPVMHRILENLNVDGIEMFFEMDGRFPNHHPDPTVEANMRHLQGAVTKHGAELGIAYDGDADRIGAIDENGRIVWGDELMVIFSRSILKERAGAAIIGDVKCSQRMYDDIAKRGGRPIMWKTGHSLIKSKLREEHAALAGEMSGHMFFADRYFGFDDAIYASFRLLEIVSSEKLGLGALLADLPRSTFTPEIRLDCPDDRKFEVVRRAAEFFRKNYRVIDIDGVRVRFDDGWGLVRASNTQPALVMRFEANSAKRLEEIRSLFETKLKELGAI